MASNRFLAALAALDAQNAAPASSTPDFSAVDAAFNDHGPSAPKKSNEGGAFDWKGHLAQILNVVSAPLHTITSAAVTGGREVGKYGFGKDYGANNPSLKNMLDMIIDPKKEVNFGDVVSGQKSKGLNVGIFKTNKGREDSSIFDQRAPALVRSGIGLAGDIALDPLTSIEGGGAAKDVLAREAAQSTARQAITAAAEDSGQDISREAVEKAVNEGGDHSVVLGKIREAAADNPRVQDIVARGQDVVARVRRGGISALDPDEIHDFLTKEQTLDEPLARRGLEIGRNHTLIPGTDNAVLGKIGEAKAGLTAKLGDMFGGSAADKAFTEQTTRELTAAARSGDGKAAYEAVLTKAARDTAKSGARGLIAQWSGKLAALTKDFSDEDMKNLRPALEGDQGAIAALDGAHEGVRDLLDDIHARAGQAGIDVNKLADYAPRELSDEGRKLLGSSEFYDTPKLGPTSSFERARSLVPDENGDYHFGGKTFKADTNAEVSAKVNEIARTALEKIDPAAAKNFTGFFNEDAQSSISHYINRAARRISGSDAASRLYAMGIGNAKYRSIADPAAQVEAEGLRDEATAADAASHVQNERSVTAGLDRDELGRHLLGQRLGQLDLSTAGTPVTSPLSDAEELALATAHQHDASAAVVEATSRLDKLDVAATARAEAGSASAKTLQEDIHNLRVKLDHTLGDDPVRQDALLQRIKGLENEHSIWKNRSQAMIDDAIAGRRSDVVMPAGFRTIDGEVTAVGGFKEVTPRVAWRNAGAIGEHVQDSGARFNELYDARKAYADAVRSGDSEGAKAAFDDFLSKASPHQGGDIIERAAHNSKLGNIADSHYDMETGNPIHPKMRATMDRVMKAVERDKQIADRELGKASVLAEKATRLETGIVDAPLFHGTQQRWTNDLLGGRTADNTVNSLDQGGLYATDDKTAKILIGERPLSEHPEMRGYTAPEDLSHSVNLKVDRREIPGGTVYSYKPRDPSVVLLPTDGGALMPNGSKALTVDHITPELGDKLDEFYGGDEWNSHFFEPDTGDEHLDELAQDDPIAAYLAHDLAQHAQAQGLSSVGTKEMVDAYYSTDMIDDQGAQGFVGGMRRAYSNAALRHTSTTETTELGTAIIHDIDAAAVHVDAMTDHWYDDFGVKGYSREGGTITGRATTSPHMHSIWVRPNDDLEMVGKADFSAAWAEKRAREALNEKARVTDVWKGNNADTAELAAKQDELDAVNRKLGTNKPTVTRQRAALAVQQAQEQSTAADKYVDDTVSDILDRRQAHYAQTKTVTAMLQNPAPLGEDAAEHMRAYVEDLHQSVLYGRVHEKALEVGDRQLTRYAALEQAAAEASANAHDLQQRAMSLNDMADQLSERQIQQVTDAFNAGAKQELRPGVGTPEQIAQWLHGAQPFSGSDGMRAFFKRTDKVVQWIKDWQIATPGFHVRNLLGGEFLNGEAGVTMESRYGFIKAYSRQLQGKVLSDADEAMMSDVRSAIGRGQVEAESSGVGMDSQLPIDRTGKGTLAPSRNNYIIRGSQRMGRQVDTYNRGVLAWHVLSNGGTLDDAVDAVNHYHFDYSDLSHFEQNLRHVVPFYTFTRKNLPLQVEQLFSNPKIYSRLAAAKAEVEGVSSPDKTTPSYYADMLGVRLPWEKNGGHMYATPDLPASSLEQFSSPREAINNIAGMVTPIIKTPIEMKFNQQFFENIPLSDKKAVPVPLPAMLVKGLAPVLEGMGLARTIDGQTVMTEKNAYVLQQFVPVIARYSRMMPSTTKGRSQQLAQLLTWAGFRVEDDSAATQKSYLEGVKFEKQDKKSTEKAFVKAAKALSKGRS